MGRNTFLTAIICSLIFIAMCMTGCGGHVGINSGGGGAINCAGCGAGGSGGGTGGSGSTTTGPVTITVLDPPTCASPRGTFNHIYVSISGVQLNPDANATASSSGWVDVAPSLSTAPKQVDMFNLGTALGNLLTSTSATGNYGSLRLLLAPDTATVTNNQCGGLGAHCVISGASTSPISTAAENTQGIVVNSGDIFGGNLSVAETGSNINILFDSCASLIPTSAGYRLLPDVVAWGGAIQTYSVTVSDATSQARLGAGTAIVALEKQGGSGFDRIWAEATPDATGIATFYAPPGTFDLVAVSTGVSGGAATMYSPLVVTDVVAVNGGGTLSVPMPLVPQGVADPGVVNAQVTANTQIDTRLSIQQSATIGTTTTQRFTIPVFNTPGATIPATIPIASGCTSPACKSGNFEVPSQPLYVRAFGSSTTNLSTSPIAYTVFVAPYLFQGAGAKDCATAAYGVNTDTSGGLLSPLPGQIVLAETHSFSGCQ
jgi:hypothetical protein